MSNDYTWPAMDKMSKENERRDKIPRSDYTVIIKDSGKYVSVMRNRDRLVKEFNRTTEWPVAQEVMDNLTPAQLSDMFGRQ
jgi:hypothetical protein